MPVEAENTTENIDGVEKDKLVVSFTNGAKEQLKELQSFYGLPSESDVVKFGISMLQRLKEEKETK